MTWTMKLGWMVSVILLVGCASSGGARVDESTSEGLMDRVGGARMLEAGIWDVQAGEEISTEELWARLVRARFVVIGESHGTEFHHEIQDRVHEGLSRHHPGGAALGMEMIEARFQRGIDAYLAGEIDETELLEEVEWAERWGVDSQYYAPMWRRARDRGAVFVGLNAPRELVREVRIESVEGLSEEDRAALPEMDLENEAHRTFLFEVFSSHGMGDDVETIERFYQAQVVWDEAMAQRAVEAMRDQDGVMVILAGRFHVERRFGIPSRIVRRGYAEEEVVTLIPVEVGSESYRDLDFLQREAIADYVWVSE